MRSSRPVSLSWYRWPHHIEVVLLLAVLAGLGETVHRYIHDGWLPQPFAFDMNDTFMDWFNTAYWAHHRGAYDLWTSVYPPLSFVFLKLFGNASCYVSDPFAARECDVIGRIAIYGWYLAATILAYVAFRRTNAATAVLRGIAFAFGLPMVFTLERGNLILPCMVFFIIAHGNLIRSRLVSGVAAAVTINFKPYLVLPVVTLAVRRDWRQIEVTGLLSLFLFFVTWGLLGDGSPMQLAANTAKFVAFAKGQIFEGVYYTTSYVPFLELDTYRFPTRDFIDSKVFEPAMAIIPVVVRSCQAIGVLALAGAWLQPRAVTSTRNSILILGISLVGQSPGGYTEGFLIFLIFLERNNRPWPVVALVAAYLLSIPYDYVFSRFVELHGDSWLSGRTVSSSIGFSIGILARPMALIVITWAMAIDTLLDVTRAHRTNRVVLGFALPTAQ